MQTKADEDEVRAIVEKFRKWQERAWSDHAHRCAYSDDRTAEYSRGKAHAYEAAADYLISIIAPEGEED